MGWIEVYRPQGSIRNSVTIVFDGRPGMWQAPSSISVKVIFTSGQSADDKIKEIVSEAHNKKQIIVVTDDREIKYYVRSLGAIVMTVADFLNKLRPSQGKIKKTLESLGPPQSTRGIPKTIEQQITAELAKIWLGPKQKNNLSE